MITSSSSTIRISAVLVINAPTPVGPGKTQHQYKRCPRNLHSFYPDLTYPPTGPNPPPQNIHHNPTTESEARRSRRLKPAEALPTSEGVSLSVLTNDRR